jgi:general L-amino acid transport system substrate-binding protein
MNSRHLVFGFVMLAAAFDLHAAGPTVDSIRKNGALICGIDQSEAEYSTTDEHGSRVDFDHDICNAVAAAILGKSYRVILKGYPDEDTALNSLRNHEIDVVASVSDDFTHSTGAGVRLSNPILFDWQSFMVPRSSQTKHASQLAGKKICFLSETEGEVNVRSWFKKHRLDFVPFPFQEEGEMEAAFVTGNCSALFGDATRLANTRVAAYQRGRDYVILPDFIAFDPLAAASRNDDSEFSNIVDWTIQILLLAEEKGITKQNLAATLTSSDPATTRLLDQSHTLGRPLNLDDHWPGFVIGAVGNYGEIFQRDVGQDSALKLPRNQNALRINGGLMQALQPK